MAQGRSTLLAGDPPIPSTSFASMGRVSSDQLISELLQYGQPHVPGNGSGLQGFMDHVAKLAKILTGAGGSAIALRGEQGTICRARSGEGAPPLGAPVDTSFGISKQCLDSGRSLRCDDIATDGRVDPEICLAAGIRALAVVPIYRDGKISGILEVFSSTPGVFTDQHLGRLQRLASWLGSITNIPAEKPIYSSNVEIQPTGPPDITLLVELEPAHRVFFGNLAGLVWQRSPAHGAVPSNLTHEWNDIFVPAHIPWKRFLQSVFLHVVVVGMLSGISKIYPPEVLVFRPPVPEAQVTYYPFSQSFPARESSRPAVHPRRQNTAQRQVKAGGSKWQDPAPHPEREAGALTTPLPAMPMVAIGRFRQPGLETATPVLPLPDIDGVKARQPHLPTSPVVGPPPDLRHGSGARSLDVPNVAVVSPSPEVPGSIAGGRLINTGRLGAGSAGSPAALIVQPPPSLNNRPLLPYGATGVNPQPGEQVVAPPPSDQLLTKFGTGRGAISSGGGVSQVIAPPPSLEGGGTSVGEGRARSPGGSSSQVVPPPPSMQNGGSHGGGRQISSLAHTDAQVVPPPPSVQGGPGRIDGAGGRDSSLTRADAEGVLPPTTQPSENFEPGSAKVAKDAGSAASSAAEAGDRRMRSMVQEVQLRVLGLAWAPARSSYFSNFEVFVAEKWLNKEQSQFIKLVYEFLPYQQRLSEYGFDAKVRKLRVTRDPTCDESILQMAGSEGTKLPAGGYSRDAVASTLHDSNEVLPCYRTTADDYRRAVSKSKSRD